MISDNARQVRVGDEDIRWEELNKCGDESLDSRMTA
jgi:hypothetical protein